MKCRHIARACSPQAVVRQGNSDIQWPLTVIPIVQSRRPYGKPCCTLISSCTLFSGVSCTSQCCCSYPAVGEGGVTLLNQHGFDDFGVQDSHHRLPAIVNPGGGEKEIDEQPQIVELQANAWERKHVKCSSITSLAVLQMLKYKNVEIRDRRGLPGHLPSVFVNDKGAKHLPNSLGNELGSDPQRSRY